MMRCYVFGAVSDVWVSYMHGHRLQRNLLQQASYRVVLLQLLYSRHL
jgi:hypothetical protein